MDKQQYDLCIIGGGINGCGIAADAAGRGLSVLLCEQDDLASATSSKSSKLIHGGLRYLEYREFRLVREALKEREVLLKKAPHLIREMRFVLPHEKHLRPIWVLRVGLFLYDHLAKRKSIKASKKINLSKDSYGKALVDHLKTGFVYSDCWVDDARLVLANALAAQQHGASILSRTRCIAAKRENHAWTITLKTQTGEQQIRAKALVNASGPWISHTINHIIQDKSRYHAKLVKGSHIVVPRLYEGEHAYILQNKDGRIVFAIPYEDNLTLIGTTDEAFTADPCKVEIDQSEIAYLCDIINQYFKKQIKADDVVWHYSGVRPLHDESGDKLSAISRDYALELRNIDGAPLINIFGGKITTYRKLAEHTLQKLTMFFPKMKPAWTTTAALPGGDIDSVDEYFLKLQQQYAWLPVTQLQRYLHQYGTFTESLLKDCRCIEDLGQHFAADLYEQEVKYLCQHEWAQTTDDILWRRTKLGLRLSEEETNLLDIYLGNRKKTHQDIL